MSCLAVAKYFMYQSVNSSKRGEISSLKAFLSLEVHRAVVVPIDLVPEAQHPILRQIRARRAVEQLMDHVFELHEVDAARLVQVEAVELQLHFRQVLTAGCAFAPLRGAVKEQ